MTPEQRITDMRRRIRHWLQTANSNDKSDSEWMLKALDADLRCMESDLKTSFPQRKSAQNPFDSLREQKTLRDVPEPMVPQHSPRPGELSSFLPYLTPAQTLHGRILLTEDGSGNQRLVSTILNRQGLEVDIADEGEAAVKKILEARVDKVPYDLVLMDMQMPRLNGYDATAQLRRKGYSKPILALTAHSVPGERARCLAAGCNDYLTKPVAQGALLAAVKAYLTHIPSVAENLRATAGASVVGKRENPVYSNYASDPDMDELVAGFVERLPSQIGDIRAAANDKDIEQLRRLAHQLKGAAGGYGFPSVSREAARLEEAARNASHTHETSDSLESLVTLCDRVRYREPE